MIKNKLAEKIEHGEIAFAIEMKVWNSWRGICYVIVGYAKQYTRQD